MTINEIDQKNEIENEQIISLVFDCYEMFKFIEMIEKYTSEIEFVFENRQLTIVFFDDSNKIMCCKCVKELNNSHGCELLTKMKFPISTKTFRDVIKVRKDDKKELELIFNNSKTYIEVIKTSDKYNSTIKGIFNLLDDDTIEELNLERLMSNEYTSKASFQIKYLNDFFYESGKYAEIINITINTNGIVFNEIGVSGVSDYIIEAKYCNILDGYGYGSYSLEYLKNLNKLLPILDTTKYVLMKIKNDNPIRLELTIDSLDMNLTIFLAPRCEENNDYDDDDEYLENNYEAYNEC